MQKEHASIARTNKLNIHTNPRKQYKSSIQGLIIFITISHISLTLSHILVQSQINGLLKNWKSLVHNIQGNEDAYDIKPL